LIRGGDNSKRGQSEIAHVIPAQVGIQALFMFRDASKEHDGLIKKNPIFKTGISPCKPAVIKQRKIIITKTREEQLYFIRPGC
jgi:hypothetical protein